MLLALLLLWLLGAASIGFVAARVVLGGERRLAVLAAFALGSGQSIQGLALLLLWGYLPLGTGFFVTVSLSILVAAVFAVRSRTRHPDLTWGMSRVDTCAVAALIAAFAFVGYRVFTVGYKLWDAELLFFHSAVVEGMTRGNYPPLSPLEPNDLLRYRFAYHTLAAAIRSHVTETSPEVLAAVTSALLPLLLTSFVGLSLRYLGRARPGMMAAVIGLLGGSLLPWYRLVEVAVSDPAESLDPKELVDGVVWHGNTLDMIHVSPTVAVGFVMLIPALWIVSEVLDGSSWGWRRYVIGIIALAYLGLVNEVHFVMLAVGAMGYGTLAFLRRMKVPKQADWKVVIAPIVMAAAAYALVTLRGGLAGGIALFGGGADSMQLILNLDHIGEVVGPPRGPVSYWLPLLSTSTQFDSDFILLGLPVLLAMAWRARSSFVLRALVGASTAAVAWLTVYSQQFPADTFRLGQGALVIYLAMLPLVFDNLYAKLAKDRRILRWIAPVVVSALIIPHALFAISLAFETGNQTRAVPGSADFEAAAYLRESTGTRRVFVPFASPDGNFGDLYRDGGPGASMRDLLALSRHSIPIGHGSYWNPGAYLPDYREASASFDADTLAALKIDWVYVLPQYLSSQQKSALQAAKESGRLEFTRSFGQEGTSTERTLFRVTSVR